MAEIVLYEELREQMLALEKVEKQISLIETVPNAKGKRDEIEALRVYAKQSGQLMAVQNRFAEIRLRLERRTGELIIEHGAGPGNPQLCPRGIIGESQSLSDFGVSAKQSSKWQKIALIPVDVFESFLVSMREGVQEITTAAALKLYRAAASVERKVKTMEIDVQPGTDAGDIVLGCMVEQILDMKPEIADLILTDPPFGLGDTANIEFRERANMSEAAGEWDDPTTIINNCSAWAEMFRRAIKPTGSLYCFTADKFISEMYTELQRVGFIIRELLVWHKTNPPPSVRKSSYRSNVEYIIYATAGEDYTRNWLGQERMTKCRDFPICGGAERLAHPTQKPVKLLKEYIEMSTNPGDLVLDPFAGVGSTGVAAMELGRRYLLIERDDYYYAQACIRLCGPVPGATTVF